MASGDAQGAAAGKDSIGAGADQRPKPGVVGGVAAHIAAAGAARLVEGDAAIVGDDEVGEGVGTPGARRGQPPVATVDRAGRLGETGALRVVLVEK